MAREEVGGVGEVERRGTLELLTAEALFRGWSVRVDRKDDSTYFFRPEGGAYSWPPKMHVGKSEIPALAEGAVTLCSVLTVSPSRAAQLRFPVCVKPDRGSLGVGFRRINDAAELKDVCTLPDDGWVMQPFLHGVEYRVSLCRNGSYATAQLIERKGELSRWDDVTEGTRMSWLLDLDAIIARLAVPIIGVDILVSEDGVAFILDINPAPDIAIHLVTTKPRNLSGAILDSWTNV